MKTKCQGPCYITNSTLQWLKATQNIIWTPHNLFKPVNLYNEMQCNLSHTAKCSFFSFHYINLLCVNIYLEKEWGIWRLREETFGRMQGEKVLQSDRRWRGDGECSGVLVWSWVSYCSGSVHSAPGSCNQREGTGEKETEFLLLWYTLIFNQFVFQTE